MDKIYTEEQPQQKVVTPKSSDSSSDIDLEEIQAECESKLNINTSDHTKLDSHYFELLLKENYKVYTFEGGHLKTAYNLLANFIGEAVQKQSSAAFQRNPDPSRQTASFQILAPFQF